MVLAMPPRALSAAKGAKGAKGAAKPQTKSKARVIKKFNKSKKPKKRDPNTPKPRKTRKRQMKSNEQTFVYILQSTVEANKSYVGVTNSLPRRLRQHNGQLSGGARYTTRCRPWRFHAIFATGNRHDALSIEWKIKHKKRKSDGPGIVGKIAAACRFGKLVAKFSQISGPLPAIPNAVV